MPVLAEDLFDAKNLPCSDYQPIIDEFGDILIQVDDDNYSGDTRVLYQVGNSYGWLQFGWGSCSGCDALQSCYTMKEMQELIDELENSIRWFSNKEEALEFFKTHDWEGDYSHWDFEQRKFVGAVIALLEG